MSRYWIFIKNREIVLDCGDYVRHKTLKQITKHPTSVLSDIRHSLFIKTQRNTLNQRRERVKKNL